MTHPGSTDTMDVLSPPKPIRVYEYQKIKTLSTGPSVNFFGRVLAFKPPQKTRGRDWGMSMIVADDSFEYVSEPNSPNPTGMAVLIFRPSNEGFPDTLRVGDVVQFRHFKVQEYGATLQAITTNWSAFTVFRQVTPDHWESTPERAVTEGELATLNRIAALETRADVPVATSVSTAQSIGSPTNTVIATGTTKNRRSTLTVREIRSTVFFNGYFKVLRILPSTHDENFVLLLCDYTENSQLFGTPEAADFPSHLRQCLLYTTLWDSFAAEARRLRIQAGNYVYLNNLVGRPITNDNGKTYITAVMHGDKAAKAGDRVRIVLPTDSEAKEIEKRAIRQQQLQQFVDEREKVFEMAEQAHQQQEERERRARLAAETAASSVSNVPFECTQIGGEGIVITNVLSVRSFPEDNAKFCVKARALSLFPGNMDNFVRFLCGDCQRSTELTVFASHRTCMHCGVPENYANGRFIWLFGIVLEDATGDLPAIVADDDAEELLGCPAALLAYPGAEATIARVHSALKKLLENGRRDMSDPHRENLFCLKSYRVDTAGVSGIRYRIFNTRMF